MNVFEKLKKKLFKIIFLNVFILFWCGDIKKNFKNKIIYFLIKNILNCNHYYTFKRILYNYINKTL
jgi:hypothetical protein